MSKRFKTQDYARFKKLGLRWRKPSGRQSKLRVKKAGSGMLVKIGYGTSKAIRGKIRGVDAALVNNADELDGKKAVVVSGSVGLKKAKTILEKAEKLGIKVLNKRSIKDGLALLEKAKAQKTEKVKKDAKETEKKTEHKKETAAKEKAEEATVRMPAGKSEPAVASGTEKDAGTGKPEAQK